MKLRENTINVFCFFVSIGRTVLILYFQFVQKLRNQPLEKALCFSKMCP